MFIYLRLIFEVKRVHSHFMFNTTFLADTSYIRTCTCQDGQQMIGGKGLVIAKILIVQGFVLILIAWSTLTQFNVHTVTIYFL